MGYRFLSYLKVASKLYYQKNMDELFKEFYSGPAGLTDEEAAKRLEKYGPNTLEAEERISPLKTLIRQFADPLIYILLIAAAFTAFIQHYIDMWVILAVVIVNAVIGFTQEMKAEQAIRSLVALSAPRAMMMGNKRKIIFLLVLLIRVVCDRKSI